MRVIDKIIQEYIDNIVGEDTTNSWILINPKTERELFLDGSLKKSDSIDDVITFDLPERGLIPACTVKLKTVITTKVDTFLIL